MDVNKSDYHKYPQIPIIIISFLLFSFEFDFSWRGNVTTANKISWLDVLNSFLKERHVLLQACLSGSE